MIDFGFSQFNIGTVSNTGLVSIKQDAVPGMIGMLVAGVEDERYYPGFSSISVAVGDNCNCGTTLSGATNIILNTNAVNLSLLGSISVSRPASVVNAQGTVLTGATVTYCSDNLQAATVDSHGSITAVGPGTATITVCHGTLKKTITVNVTI